MESFAGRRSTVQPNFQISCIGPKIGNVASEQNRFLKRCSTENPLGHFAFGPTIDGPTCSIFKNYPMLEI